MGSFENGLLCVVGGNFHSNCPQGHSQYYHSNPATHAPDPEDEQGNETYKMYAIIIIISRCIINIQTVEPLNYGHRATTLNCPQ